MANYTASNLVKAQARLTSDFEKSELRFRTPATHLAFIANSNFIFPDYKSLKTREDRALEVYFKKRTPRALGASRTHNHTGAHGDSGILTPSFLTYSDPFTMSIKQGDNNVFDFEEQYMNEFMNVMANVSEGLESAAVSHLFTNRTNVNAAAIEGAFNGIKFVYEITEASVGERAIQITTTVMDFLKYSGAMTIFCDSIAYNKFRFQAAQGATNATNLSFQFQNITFVHSPDQNALAVGLGYTKGYWTAVPAGTIGALDWIPKQNREGRVTSVNKYGSLINPVDGLVYATHEYETRADGSATNGQKQDVVVETQISIDIAYEHAPLSVAGETTIIAAALI